MDKLAIIAMLLDGINAKNEKWEFDWAVSQATHQLQQAGWVKNGIDGHWQKESA